LQTIFTLIKRTWYFLLQWYVYFGLKFYFKKLIVKGTENIPQGPVIFAANHQNAFLDALVMATTNQRYDHFLVRADIFKKPFARWLLGTLNMKPIYRIRDGWQALAQNKETFDYCKEVFANGQSIIMFPEGSHGEKRRVRQLSKGFTRVAFETLEQYPELTINIVPIGLNYTAHQKFRSSASIYFGPPIKANDYFKEPLQGESARLRLDLMESMKKLTLHIEDLERYSEIIAKLENSGVDYLDPVDANQRVANIDHVRLSPRAVESNSAGKILLFPFYYVALLVNALPLALWNRTAKKIKDPVFIASIKFCLGIFVFPAVYILETLIVYKLVGMWEGIAFGFFCVLSMLIIEFVRRDN
jgi:1-acyl-sn-glycerol-3-phosphate acyltransferase